MNSSQSTRSGTWLLRVGTTAWNRKNTTLSNKDNMAIRKLLFEFTSNTSLNLGPSLLSRNWYKDNDSLLAITNLDLSSSSSSISYSLISFNPPSHLLSSSNLERTKILLQLGNVVFQVDKSLSNSELEFSGRLCTSNFSDLVRSHVGQN